MKRWIYPLITGVVVTVCVMTVMWAADCHRLSRLREEPPTGLCKDADSRALATLMGLLSTLLALAVRTDDESPTVRPGRASDSEEMGADSIRSGNNRSVGIDLAGSGSGERGSKDQATGD